MEASDAEEPPLAKLRPREALAPGLRLGGGEGMPINSAEKRGGGGEAGRKREVGHRQLADRWYI